MRIGLPIPCAAFAYGCGVVCVAALVLASLSPARTERIESMQDFHYDDELNADSLPRRRATFSQGDDLDQQPSTRALHGMDAWDMYVGEVYLFGGCVNMTDTGDHASLAMWRGCTHFSNEVWKMFWNEHSGQILWFPLFQPPNTTQPTIDSQSANNTTYAAARAGSSVLGFDLAGSGSGVTTLFIFGGVGEQAGAPFNDVWFFDTERQHWMAIPAKPSALQARAYHSTVHWQHLMLIFGGFAGKSSDPEDSYVFLSDVLVFNTTDQVWHSIPQPAHVPWPDARFHHAAMLHSSFRNTMFMYGGVSGTGGGPAYTDIFLDDVWKMTWSDGMGLVAEKVVAWTKLSPSPTTIRPPPLFGHAMTWCNSSEFAVLWGMTPNMSAPGKASATQKAWRLDIVNMRWRAPTGLYEAARAFCALTPIGCGGWLSDGVSQIGEQPELRHDFENAGILP